MALIAVIRGKPKNGNHHCHSNKYCANRGVRLGWEFRFWVLISGTPIGSGILILFLIPKITVGIFFEISMSGESENWNSDLRYSEFW